MAVELSCTVNNKKEESKFLATLRGIDLIGKILAAESGIHDQDKIDVSGNIKGVNYGNGTIQISFLPEKPGSKLDKITAARTICKAINNDLFLTIF